MAAPARALVAIAVVLASVATLPAQSALPDQSAQVFRAGVETVVLDVAVSRGGAPVRGLDARHFVIIDNGVPRPAETVVHDTVPLNLILCVDTSSSLGEHGMQQLREAADGLLTSLRPDDRVGLVTFTEAIEVRVPPTARHEAVREAMRGLSPQGPTAWRDAVFVASHLVEPSRTRRSVVLLLTDGSDTSSWIRRAQLDETMGRSGVVVHAVQLDSRAVSLSEAAALRRTVSASGGRVWPATSERQLRRLFLEVLHELRDRYLVAYVPPEPVTPGWHAVTVRLDGVRGEVQARPGYQVPRPR